MKFVPWSRGLYWRIVVLYMAAVVIAVAGTAVIYWWQWRRDIYMVNQRVNWNVAKELAAELEPLLVQPIDEDALTRRLAEIAYLNPAMEVFILDSGGTIVHSLVGLVDRKVPVELVQSFLDASPKDGKLFSGPHPWYRKNRHFAFVASPIRIDNSDGYLYVLLSSFRSISLYNRLGDTLAIGGGAIVFFSLLFIASMFGVYFYRNVSRRFVVLSTVMSEFSGGSYSIRAIIDRDDELGIHSQAFNKMAESIERDIDLLKQADSNRRELVANVSHDLRLPIAVMQSHLETIQMKLRAASKQELRKLLQEAVDACEALSVLVSELFELAKLNSADYVVKAETVSLDELVFDIGQKFEQTCLDKNVSLEIIIPDRSFFVEGEIRLIDKALRILMDNAVRFTEAGGEITLSLEQSERNLEVLVKDTGLGIAKDELNYIFNRFYRRGAGQPLQKEHTGLGLAVAKRVAEVHGGSLSVESEVGRGSTFCFSVPG